MKAIIKDGGDPSVGIFPRYWEADVPFTVSDVDMQTIEWFRKQLENLYGEFAEGKLTVDYDYELMYAAKLEEDAAKGNV